jgi:hypothetical protein
VQLQNGLAVFSPVALTPTVKSVIEKTNLPVRYLIAPDIEHHISLSAWSAAYPSARILAPEGLPEKRAQQNHKNKSVTILDFFKVFTAAEKNSPEGITVDPEFDREFTYELVDAHPNKELVFVHNPTKTLITADMLFNLPGHEQYSKSSESATSGFFTRLAMLLQGTGGAALGQKRFLWYALSAKDRQGWNKSVQKINTWDFKNIVPCHGESIVGNGKEIWGKVFEWHLNGKH